LAVYRRRFIGTRAVIGAEPIDSVLESGNVIVDATNRHRT
jgi:hypothetical protein